MQTIELQREEAEKSTISLLGFRAKQIPLISPASHCIKCEVFLGPHRAKTSN
jgi:hypothetical protein